ncbi:MAG TPA: type II CAAX endopeptidase family protein [Solirubrobacteraceae bacterium]|nr:type II CAAX endopeptidase family protein [Solirubrobacteraceae bacterium]
MSHVPPQFQPGLPPPPPDPADATATAAAPVQLEAHEQSGRDRWPAWLSIAGFAVGFGTTIVLGLFIIVISGAFGASTEDPPPGINIALTLAQNLGLVVAAYFFARLSGRPTAADFGLRPTRVWRSVRLLVAVWIGFFVLSGIWAVALGLEEQQSLPDELGADGSTLNALVVIVLVTVIAPLGEELFFRGFFFGALRNWRGPIVAAVLSGAVFGVFHAGSSPIGYLVPLAIFGFGLCLLYELTGSLYPSIALHALNNSIALGVNLDYGAGIIVAMMVGSTIVTLLCARLLALALGDRRPGPPASAPAPEPT